MLAVLALLMRTVGDGAGPRDASSPSDHPALWGPPYPGADAVSDMALDATRPAAQPAPLALPDGVDAVPLLMMARATSDVGRPLVISTRDEHGRPLPGVEVVVRDMDGNIVARCETQLADDALSARCEVERPPGVMQVDGRLAGAVVFERRPPGATTPAPIVGFPYVPPEWDEVVLSLQAGLTVRVVVTNAADGEPVPFASVAVHDGRVVDAWYTCMVPLAVEYTADETGVVTFELASRAARTLALHVRAEGFAELPIQELAVPAGWAVYDAAFTLERAPDVLCIADVP